MAVRKAEGTVKYLYLRVEHCSLKSLRKHLRPCRKYHIILLIHKSSKALCQLGRCIHITEGSAVDRISEFILHVHSTQFMAVCPDRVGWRLIIHKCHLQVRRNFAYSVCNSLTLGSFLTPISSKAFLAAWWSRISSSCSSLNFLE